MTQQSEHKTIDDAVELLKSNGFDGSSLWSAR